MDKAGSQARANPSGKHAASRAKARHVGTVLMLLLTACLAVPALAAVNLSALEDDPCLIVPAQLVSEVFDVPEDDIEQVGLSMMGHLACESTASDDDNELNAQVTTEILDSPAKAEQYFASATRSMSKQDVAEAAQRLESRDAGPGSSEELANKLVGALTGDALAFEDVHDIGDEARFNEKDGTLTVRRGNLILAIQAYYGPGMPMPDDMSKFVQAAEQWQKDTTIERKQAAVRLAAAVLDTLK